MPQIYNGKTCYSFEEVQKIIDDQIKHDAREAARIICERRLARKIEECV